MKILYTSYCCSQPYFQRLFDSATVKPSQAAQKFNSLMVTGFMKNGTDVTCLTGRPVTTRSHSKKFWKEKKESVENIHYVYIPIVNNPIIKQFIYFWYSFFYSLIWALKNKNEGAVVTDILCDPVTKGSAIAARIIGIPVNGIVTDLPGMKNFDESKSLLKKIDSIFSINPFKLCTQYTPLTEQMCDLINPRHKPYVVVEGLVDSEMETVERINLNDAKRHICYTGQIFEQYGIKKLIEAFMQVEYEDVVLDIYGQGPMSEDMPYYMKKDARIVYHGCVPLEEARKAQLSAYLLVNPRPTHEEYTKYSFPSKNMECMVSGAPLLTTLLPGMPKEYQEHVFLFKDESVSGMVDTLNEIIGMASEDIIAMGEDGRTFVLTYKNNITQSRKIIELLSLR